MCLLRTTEAVKVQLLLAISADKTHSKPAPETLHNSQAQNPPNTKPEPAPLPPLPHFNIPHPLRPQPSTFNPTPKLEPQTLNPKSVSL